jgi:hypothetical protein
MVSETYYCFGSCGPPRISRFCEGCHQPPELVGDSTSPSPLIVHVVGIALEILISGVVAVLVLLLPTQCLLPYLRTR